MNWRSRELLVGVVAGAVAALLIALALYSIALRGGSGDVPPSDSLRPVEPRKGPGEEKYEHPELGRKALTEADIPKAVEAGDFTGFTLPSLISRYQSTERSLRDIAAERLSAIQEMEKLSKPANLSDDEELRMLHAEMTRKKQQLDGGLDRLPGMPELMEKEKAVRLKRHEVQGKVNMVRFKIKETQKKVDYTKNPAGEIVQQDPQEQARLQKELEAAMVELEEVEKDHAPLLMEMTETRKKARESDPVFRRLASEATELELITEGRTRQQPAVLALRKKIKELEDQYAQIRKESNMIHNELIRRPGGGGAFTFSPKDAF